MSEGEGGAVALVEAGVVPCLVGVAAEEADEHLVEGAVACLGRLSRFSQVQVGEAVTLWVGGRVPVRVYS